MTGGAPCQACADEQRRRLLIAGAILLLGLGAGGVLAYRAGYAQGARA